MDQRQQQCGQGCADPQWQSIQRGRPCRAIAATARSTGPRLRAIICASRSPQCPRAGCGCLPAPSGSGPRTSQSARLCDSQTALPRGCSRACQQQGSSASAPGLVELHSSRLRWGSRPSPQGAAGRSDPRRGRCIARKGPRSPARCGHAGRRPWLPNSVMACASVRAGRADRGAMPGAALAPGRAAAGGGDQRLMPVCQSSASRLTRGSGRPVSCRLPAFGSDRLATAARSSVRSGRWNGALAASCRPPSSVCRVAQGPDGPEREFEPGIRP